MLRRVLRLARMLCALMYRQNGDLANLLKSARKKSAPECPFECGGGVQKLKGQCPNARDMNLSGASLTTASPSGDETFKQASVTSGDDIIRMCVR